MCLLSVICLKSRPVRCKSTKKVMAKTRKRKESLLVRNLTSSSVLWPPIFNWNVVRVTTKIVEPWNDSNFCTLFFLLTRPLSYWLRKPKCNFQQHQKMWAGQLKEVGEWSLSGAHHQEPATTPYSCHGVFTDRSIFSLNLFRMEPQWPIAITSTD